MATLGIIQSLAMCPENSTTVLQFDVESPSVLRSAVASHHRDDLGQGHSNIDSWYRVGRKYHRLSLRFHTEPERLDRGQWEEELTKRRNQP